MRKLVHGMILSCIGALVFVFSSTASADTERPPGYDDLVALYAEFREFALPRMNDGVPDYTPDAMARQYEGLADYFDRLDAIDDADWPVARRVDYMLVLAEMRGLKFQHRVVQPWRRDPAFYSTTNLGFGPKMHGAFPAPEPPITDADEAAEITARLQRVPAVLTQARENLDDARGDLARLGIMQKEIEENLFNRVASDADGRFPELAAAAHTAAAAVADFNQWLREIEADLPPHGGVGRDEYDWFLRYVMLFPYDWDEIHHVGEREYQRSMAFLKMEQHRNRDLPEMDVLSTLEEFMRRQNAADADLLEFLASEGIMTVPDYLVPPGEGPYVLPADRDPERPGLFDEPISPHFFFQASFRDPRPLRAHNVPGHRFDNLLRERDERPIRGEPRLFFVDGIRVEGWAFYLEEMVLQTGFYDERPKTREINYILQAKRAARVKPELMMHANRWTYDQALESLVERTPYWMEPGDAIAQFDIELYLRQPGYGMGYYLGKVELEKLLADVALAQGDDFDLGAFHDSFLAAGRIPISLIRWEMTGDDSEVRRMRSPETELPR